jgi:hypothetical protein
MPKPLSKLQEAFRAKLQVRGHMAHVRRSFAGLSPLSSRQFHPLLNVLAGRPVPQHQRAALHPGWVLLLRHDAEGARPLPDGAFRGPQGQESPVQGFPFHFPPLLLPTHPAQYHDGFRAQVAGWPSNPLDVMIDEIRRQPGASVADMGCGEARLAVTLGREGRHPSIHSFDLVAPLTGEGRKLVTPCDVSRVPLPNQSVDVAVFCLSLMGTDYWEFVREADRILKPGGRLLVAEVRSRFEGGGGEEGGGGGGGAAGAGEEQMQAQHRHHHQQGPHGKHGGQKRGREAGGGGGGVTAGVGAFIAAVERLGQRGYTVTRRDERNTMFVLLFFKKKGGPTGETAQHPQPPRPLAAAASSASREEEDEDDEDDGEGRSDEEGADNDGAAARASSGGDGDGGEGNKKKKKKRRKNKNKFRMNGEGGGGGGGGGGNLGRGPVALPPSLKACVYKRR